MQVVAAGLGHAFDQANPLFTDLSFTFGAGEIIALTGPSGSGKSTLLSLIARWDTPTAGRIEWDGIESVSWVFQNPFGVPGRSVLDHAVLPLVARGFSRRDAESRALAILETFDLDSLADQTFATLSGGEAQRLMLARAVAKRPSLLLVDEPTAQLDRRAADTVNKVLSGLAQSDSIVVVATHDPDTRDACGRVIDLGSSS